MTLRTWIAIRAFIFFIVGQITGHVLLTVIVIVAWLLLLLFSVWAYTEVLWYEAIGYLDVLITLVAVQLGMAAAPFVAMSVFVIVNMNLARKLAPSDRVISADETRVDRWRRASAPFARPLITAIGLLCGLIIALQTFVHWDTFLLWWHGGHWGRSDPQFERDLSYFMFHLAFYTLVQRWTFIGVLVTLVLTVLTSYLFGGIRPQAPGAKIPFQVNLHISVLMLALIVLIGWGMILELHLLSYSERGVITGLGFTDSNASLVAYKFVATAVVTGFFLFQVNIRRPGWIIPTLALVWLFLVGLSIARFYPNIYQFLVVEPQELEREYPFIEDHLAFTRYGFDLDKVERRQTPGNDQLTAEELAAYRPALEQIRLWDPDTMIINFRELQALRTYFDFEDVDVDRYRVDGEETLVLVGAREVKTTHLAESAHRWENQRMIYTHGHGLVAASGTLSSEAGMPVFLTRDLPMEGASAIDADNPQIYFGEASSPYAFVATDTIELDRPIDPSSQPQPSGASPSGDRPAAGDTEGLPDRANSSGRERRGNRRGRRGVDRSGRGVPAGSYRIRHQRLQREGRCADRRHRQAARLRRPLLGRAIRPQLARRRRHQGPVLPPHPRAHRSRRAVSRTRPQSLSRGCRRTHQVDRRGLHRLGHDALFAAGEPLRPEPGDAAEAGRRLGDHRRVHEQRGRPRRHGELHPRQRQGGGRRL